MKKFLQSVLAFIKNAFAKVDDATKKLLPVVINVVQALKAVMDSPYEDVISSIIKGLIPGTADDVLIGKIEDLLRKYLPTVLLDIQMVNSIANITDLTEQLKAILDQFKLSPDDLKNKAYHDLSTLLLYDLADGKLTWSEAVTAGEFYYQNIYKPSLAQK